MPGHTTDIQACRGAPRPRHHHRLRHCIKRPQSTVPTSRGDTVLTTQQAALLPGGKRHGQVPRVLCTSIAAPPHISQAPISIVGCVRHTEPTLTGKERCQPGETKTSSRTPDRPQQTETAHCFSAYYCANHSTLFFFCIHCCCSCLHSCCNWRGDPVRVLHLWQPLGTRPVCSRARPPEPQAAAPGPSTACQAAMQAT